MSLIKLINAKSMADDIDTGWQKIPLANRTRGRKSIQTDWVDAGGVLNGTISYYLSNDPNTSKSAELMRTITIDSATPDITDATWQNITTPAEWLKVIYTNNGINAGTLKVFLSVED